MAQQQPDAIFCVGDFIDSDAAPAQLQQLYQLLRRLGEIAPVFFSPGNHEITYMESHGSELLDAVAATGATVLYDRWVQTTLGGAAVRIGGSCGHFRDINRSAKLDYAMEETIGAADVPGIVLLHMPESLLLDDARERWTGQVFLSGHTHGGVIRIPLIGGFNDASADAEQFAAFFRPLDTARARFEFLSYHEYGKDKWAQCGLPYRMERMKSAFVGNETVAQFQSVFAAAGLHVIHT